MKCFNYCVMLILIGHIYATELIKKSEWNITELLSQYNYPIEIHEIETEDGYLLDIYRIPYGRRSETKQVNAYPVVMMHGLLGSAENFLLTGPTKALAYKLADNGYDVWLCNARGTWHSRKHTTMDPDKDMQYWQFSWNEIGVYDLPAIIDYVLNVTQNRKLHYVGHSQGTTSFFVMASERPEYNEKIKVMVALSPVVFFKHFTNPIVKLMVPFYPIIHELLGALHVHEVFSLIPIKSIHELDEIVCGPESNLKSLCNFTLFESGLGGEQFDWSALPMIIATAPGGASIKQLFHYAQVIISGKFQKYDWGIKENIRRYGTEIPPKYNLRKITAPVAFFYGENDTLADQKDVLELAKLMPNLVELYKVPYKLWTHLDFIAAKDMDILLNDRVLEVMKKYNNM